MGSVPVVGLSGTTVVVTGAAGLCLLVYVCDHDLPADDPAGQFDALIERLPFSAASDQVCFALHGCVGAFRR